MPCRVVKVGINTFDSNIRFLHRNLGELSDEPVRRRPGGVTFTAIMDNIYRNSVDNRNSRLGG